MSCSAQQNLAVASLNQQVDQAKQRVNSLDTQISQLSGQPVSPAQQSHLGQLRAERTSAENTLSSLQQAAHRQPVDHPAGPDCGLEEQPGPERHPDSLLAEKRTLVTYAAVGLIIGLAVGLGIVILRALVSDRLRRRDDVAYALDAPVKLSVRTLRARRRLRPGLAGPPSGTDDMRRVVAHLHSAVPRRDPGRAGPGHRRGRQRAGCGAGRHGAGHVLRRQRHSGRSGRPVQRCSPSAPCGDQGTWNPHGQP